MNKSIKIYLIGFAGWVALCVVAMIVCRYTLIVPSTTTFNFTEPVKKESLPDFSHIDLSQLNVFAASKRDGDNLVVFVSDSTLQHPVMEYPQGMEDLLKWEVTNDTLFITLDLEEVGTPCIYCESINGATVRIPSGRLRSLTTSTLVPTVPEISLKGKFDELALTVCGNVSLSHFEADKITYRISPALLKEYDDPFNRPFNSLFPSIRQINMTGSTIGAIDVYGKDGTELDIQMSETTQGRGVNKRHIGCLEALNIFAEAGSDSTKMTLGYDGWLPDEINIQQGVLCDVEITTRDNYIFKGNDHATDH